MCERCQERENQDARFWRLIRRALLQVARAIEDRYPEEATSQNRRAA